MARIRRNMDINELVNALRLNLLQTSLKEQLTKVPIDQTMDLWYKNEHVTTGYTVLVSPMGLYVESGSMHGTLALYDPSKPINNRFSRCKGPDARTIQGSYDRLCEGKITAIYLQTADVEQATSKLSLDQLLALPGIARRQKEFRYE